MSYISTKMWVTPLLGMSFSVIASPAITIDNISGNTVHGAVQSLHMSGIAADSVNPALSPMERHTYTPEDGFFSSAAINIKEGDIIPLVGVFDTGTQSYEVCGENVLFSDSMQFQYNGEQCIAVQPTNIISSCKDLESIGKGPNYPGASHEEAWSLEGHYELRSDIDCSATSDSSDDSFGDDGFQIIGDMEAFFTGSLNGNNYTIKELYQRSELTGGIFYRLDPGSLIQNLSIESADIHALYRSGILSSMSLGDIANLNVSGSVTQLYPALAIEPIGGVSATGSGNYHNIHADVHIQGGADNDSIGGLFGATYPGLVITDSSVTGSIRHGKNVGGMLGSAAQSGTVHNSFVYDMVIDTFAHDTSRVTGGLIGISSIRDIKNVYVSNVDISSHGKVQAAGLLGMLTGGVPVAAENAYATGSIVSHADSNNEIAAGFIARNVAPGAVEHGFTSMDLNAGFIYRLSSAHAPYSYYNKDREYIGSVQDTASQPTSKKELKNPDWYITHLNWTEDDWAFKKGYYPILKGQDGNVLDNQEWVRVK